jgi:hypothetical protein
MTDRRLRPAGAVALDRASALVAEAEADGIGASVSGGDLSVSVALQGR